MLTAEEARLLYQVVDQLEATNTVECNLLRRLIMHGELVQNIFEWWRNGNSISVQAFDHGNSGGTSAALVVTRPDPRGYRHNDQMLATRLHVRDVYSLVQLVASELVQFVDRPRGTPAMSPSKLEKLYESLLDVLWEVGLGDKLALIGHPISLHEYLLLEIPAIGEIRFESSDGRGYVSKMVLKPSYAAMKGLSNHKALTEGLVPHLTEQEVCEFIKILLADFWNP